jgi:hypothetical protein
MTDLPNIGERRSRSRTWLDRLSHRRRPDALPGGREGRLRAGGADRLEERHIRELRTNWVRLAEHLYQWNEDKAWAALDYETLEEWLASPDIELSRSHYFRLVENYREFVVARGVKPELLGTVDFTKVREVLPAIRRGHVDPEEAIADAQALTRTDLEEKYRHRDPIKPLDRTIKRRTLPLRDLRLLRPEGEGAR